MHRPFIVSLDSTVFANQQSAEDAPLQESVKYNHATESITTVSTSAIGHLLSRCQPRFFINRSFYTAVADAYGEHAVKEAFNAYYHEAYSHHHTVITQQDAEHLLQAARAIDQGVWANH
ncbi:hypothetical protein GCM10023116_19990 [Kistimonas scapharcae]|uniref:Uncharacterized protein n=1 Tax=Kistimonas scapharcae TaxID=1036133 RepID=A0ABP8V148_9GAMM